MTVWDLVFYVGSGVSFIMSFTELIKINEKLPDEEKCSGGVVFGALICAALSWGFVVWYIGNETYRYLKIKHKRQIRRKKHG